ncbi:MAG: T9SS type A sorting domain-containing protein, partial [Bacteroidota bacterium]
LLMKLFTLQALVPPNWTPVPNLQYNMSVIGKIQLSPGVYSMNESDILGAFVGTECRGVASPVASLDGTLFLTIGSNIQSGETVTFKIYLASTDQIVDAIETIPFQNQGEVGTMADPFIFTFVGTICSVDVTPASQDISSIGGSRIFTITTISGCHWTVASDQTWCTVTPASGSSYGSITATCSQNTLATQRTANITTTIPGGSPVTVSLNQAGFIGTPNWTPLPNLQFNMSVIGKIQLSPGTFSLNGNDLIGAFVGSGCRGVANPYSSLDGMLFLTVGSNVLSGETVTFKIYLAATDVIADVNEVLSFQNYAEIGTFANPFMFTFPIQNDLVIQGITIMNGQTKCYNALQTISLVGSGTNFFVQNGGSVTAIAGQKISLKPGTTVQPGGYFQAYITETNTYCSPLASSMVNALGEEEINIPGKNESTLFLVYPNPTDGKFTLELTVKELNSPALVRIYNMNGMEVYTKQLTVPGKSELSLESQSPGIYLIKVTRDSEMKMIKIVKL